MTWLFAQLSTPVTDPRYGWIAPTTFSALALGVIYMFLTRRIRTGGEVEDKDAEVKALQEIVQQQGEALREAQTTIDKLTIRGEIDTRLLDAIKKAVSEEKPKARKPR